MVLFQVGRNLKRLPLTRELAWTLAAMPAGEIVILSRSYFDSLPPPRYARHLPRQREADQVGRKLIWHSNPMER